MKVFVKGDIRLELENGLVLSSKIMALLASIERTGSLNASSKVLGVSYSQSWNMLQRVNCQLQTPVVVTRRGGKGGGVAKLTSQGRFLLRRYNAACESWEALLQGYAILP